MKIFRSKMIEMPYPPWVEQDRATTQIYPALVAERRGVGRVGIGGRLWGGWGIVLCCADPGG